ncbi:hypothetical protein L249_0640 [Ophiocordyceps polyrhachis-furcata BCC 54312]|uniref:Phospholipase D n=1 Tax=Ophiocordyceps polyrhachis-furcata BCC 54312 TaxID=1330021 RepID=A0A367LFI9_9HYPO|nr:hypothetical protein L249_0640 [Ophiocordyceps polyrhachis-furcata BCC 54312]
MRLLGLISVLLTVVLWPDSGAAIPAPPAHTSPATPTFPVPPTSHTSREISSASAAASAAASPASAVVGAAKPFYAIAHRVLDRAGIDAAISHGANAIEIDAYAWGDGWYADHDGTFLSTGDSMRDMLQHVAIKNQEKRKLAFVWLDIKNPDWCSNDEQSHDCSIEALRDLARATLGTAGVQILYGFYTKNRGRAYNVIRDGLRHDEAIALEGDADTAQRIFEEEGPGDVRQRVYSRGYFNWTLMWPSDYRAMLDNLRKARLSGAFGHVFTWTAFEHKTYFLNKPDDPIQDVIKTGLVDGVIYGRPASQYKNERGSSWAIDQLKNRTDIHLAPGQEPPFGNDFFFS